MTAKLVHQYTARAMLLSWRDGGLEIEATKEFSHERPGYEAELQALLWDVLKQTNLDRTTSLGGVAEWIFNTMQQIGGGMRWVRVSRGAQSVTVDLRVEP